jgi:AcrR family transcriptional regulator
MATRAYRARRRVDRRQDTRERIKAAVRGMLAEGRFHESSVDEVADRAGVSRATLYQHFGSRLALVDAMCEGFEENPALQKLRASVDLADADAALDEAIACTIRFWSSEDAILSELYGVAAVDPAAKDLVDRQRSDRRNEFGRLVRNLQRSSRLRPGVTKRRALTLLLVLSAYDTFRELRAAGLSDSDATTLLQDSARRVLLSG